MQDLDTSLPNFFQHLMRHRHRIQKQRAGARSLGARRLPAPAHGDIRINKFDDFRRNLHQVDALVESRVIRFRQLIRDGFAPGIDEPMMKVRPERGIFQIRVHSRKWAWHEAPSVSFGVYSSRPRPRWESTSRSQWRYRSEERRVGK